MSLRRQPVPDVERDRRPMLMTPRHGGVDGDRTAEHMERDARVAAMAERYGNGRDIWDGVPFSDGVAARTKPVEPESEEVDDDDLG